jgi:hypothetical protein
MVVTGEGKGFGAQFAVPIAQKLLDLYFNRRWPADVGRDSTWLRKPGITPQSKPAKDSAPDPHGPFAVAKPLRSVARKSEATEILSTSHSR